MAQVTDTTGCPKPSPSAASSQRRQRGIALITALLAAVLVMALLAAMVNICTVRLRTVNEAIRAEQALAAADAGASWVRALFALHHGDLSAVLGDLAKTHSRLALDVDGATSAEVLVGVQLPGSPKHADHVDVNLQENPQIAEAPLQIVSTASLRQDGDIVATRTVTTLVRTFQHLAPYSEVVGVIDDAGPSSPYSPGDPAGQMGSHDATDLRIQAATTTGTAPPVPANKFATDRWSDGDASGSGLLP